MLKFTGAVLVMVSSTAFGYLKGKEYSDRIKELLYIKKIILMLRGEVAYSKTPLPEAFAHISKRCRQPFSSLCMKAARSLEELDGQSFWQIWTFHVEQELKGCALLKKDLLQLAGLGEQLGYLDCKMQTAVLDLYIEQLDMEIADGHAGLAKQIKLCRGLGVMGGLFIVLLML